MTKEEWLTEQIFVDEYGRDYNLSDVPMTTMPRYKAFTKRGYSDKTIDGLWKEITQYSTSENVLTDI